MCSIAHAQQANPSAPVIASPTAPSPAVPAGNAPSIPAANSGISIAAPPPPSALSPEAAQLAKQAEEAAQQAQPLSPAASATLAADQAKAQAEADEAEREQEHNAKSFDRAEKGLLPLSPNQICDFERRLETTQKASQPPSSGPPKAEVKLTTLSLDPGVDPPQINLAAGYVTTITMVDATGAPWPIMDVGVGGNFEVSPTQAGDYMSSGLCR